MRTTIGRSIEAVFPPREAGLLMGLALGDDSHLDAGVERDFKATGLTHLLVVSGGNVAMVLGPVLALVTMLGFPRAAQVGLGLATVAFIVVLTGAEPSVMRAGAMASLTLIGLVLGRLRSTAVVLSGAVMVLLILQPVLVRSIGFQLSVTATAGMVALAGPLGHRFSRVAPAPVAAAAGTTLAAQLGVTPVLLFHFHDVPGVTLIANVIAAPTVAPSLLLGLVAAGTGIASATLGHLLGLGAQVPMRALELIANVAGRAPVAHITSRGGPAVLILGTGLVIAVAVALRTGWRPPRRAIVAGVVAVPVLVWNSAASVGPPASLTVRIFDVGQGDAALVTTPAGVTMLVDGGPDEEQVATELAALGVKRLDVVVASHPHADHVVGLPSVLARFQVGVVLQPGCPSTSALQLELDRAIADEGIEVRTPWAGEAFVVGDVRLDVLRRPSATRAPIRHEQRRARDQAVPWRRRGAVRDRAQGARAGVAGGAARRGWARPLGRRAQGAAPRRGHSIAEFFHAVAAHPRLAARAATPERAPRARSPCSTSRRHGTSLITSASLFVSDSVPE